ncbi:hypothetical protein I302_102634 [Kwoniella bestiolae CBS 10118]|uniref:Aryl-alcohol dehydrogenase n=1 Tax=Kwoniella bestiolae CBS 10118 TaxID=1296100 RepID=A0A1B9GFI5_9TREE|nr:aryl-alcohol dehydrogenase [Kwoniella bestiolae CBS 10118]OCF29810.1 aryl-alcohol dehydrogenase [Kwoniella bestiolae CBS 10118]
MPQIPFTVSSKDFTPSSADERKDFPSIFPPAPEPKTELGRYRILSPSAGIRVSPLCLGAMSIGDQWTGFMGGGLNYDKSEEFLDYFYKAGGNFIDTSNNYQDEQSEIIIGEWMEKRGIRDEIVLATKYTTFPLDRKEGQFEGIRANYVGNAKKNLRLTVDASLKKLRTSYIDILYVHWWDYSTSIPELMQSLNEVVKTGKVLYLGVSDTPAWVVSQANEYARNHGLSPFVVYQGAWSLAQRDLERDVIPMARANGMGIAPWNALGGGKFKTPEEIAERKKAGTLRAGAEPTPQQVKAAQALKEVAEELGGDVKLPNVALAWVRHMVSDVYPIIGGTSIDNLKSNIEALKIELTPEQVTKLSNAVEFDIGFPYNMFGTDPHYLPDGTPNNWLLNSAAPLKYHKLP